MITYSDNCNGIDWEEAVEVFVRAPLGTRKRKPDQLKRAFESSYAVVAAFDNGKLIGLARALCDGEYQAAVYDLVLLPEYQGRGVGKVIMDKLCEKLPVENIILYAVPGKEGFYKKCGFRKMTTAMARLRPTMASPEMGYLEQDDSESCE